MSGGVTILVAKGQQDVMLTDNPQISFFRQNYKRHVNFSQTVLSQVIQGNPKEAAISTVTFDKKGDLLSYIYITKKIDGILQPDIIDTDILKVDLIIGDQVIDTLTTDQLVAMSCFNSKYPRSTRGTLSGTNPGFVDLYHYPLGFWFCENWQSALPLVALQFHDIRIRITWGELASVAGTVYEVWADYIYLDESERKYVVDKDISDTLIYQHQSSPASNSLMSVLPFNNPVAFIFSGLSAQDIMNEAPTAGTGIINLQLNGVDITDKRELYPHYNIIPLSFHTTYGKYNTAAITDTPSFIYPFSLNCSQLQPSGSCNFSRIDSAYLASTKEVVKPIYCRSYNILRISDGMGGLLFSS
tara:strand:- start:1751 stop:2821 length:1071 start_codon:yes stop_codon:yes gene_type:complete